jgi:hypothetical protein
VGARVRRHRERGELASRDAASGIIASRGTPVHDAGTALAA